MISQLSNFNKALLSLYLIACTTFLLAGAYYSNPNSEDLSLSETSRDLGTFQAVANTMVTYDGRYFTNILHGTNPLVLNLYKAYKILPVVAIALLIISVYFFLDTIFVSESVSGVALISLLLVFVYLTVKPGLVGGPFVMVGTFVYMYPLSLMIMWIAGYLRFLFAERSYPALAWFMFTLIVVVPAIGMNEMFLIPNGFFVIAIPAVLNKYRPGLFCKAIPVIIVCSACILFFVTSPGIGKRIEANQLPTTDWTLFNRLYQSIFNYFFTLDKLFFGGIALFAGLLFSALTTEVKFRHLAIGKFIQSTKTWHLLLFLLCLSYLMTLAYYIPLQIIADYPFWIFNVAIFPMLLAFVIGIYRFTWFYPPARKHIGTEYYKKQSVVSILLVILAGLTFLTPNNFSRLMQDYTSGKLVNYDKVMDSRHNVLMVAKKDNSCWKHVYLNKIMDAPTSIFFGPEINDNRNPDQWNKNYEVYFGVDEVNLVEDTVSKF